MNGRVAVEHCTRTVSVLQTYGLKMSIQVGFWLVLQLTNLRVCAHLHLCTPARLQLMQTLSMKWSVLCLNITSQWCWWKYWHILHFYCWRMFSMLQSLRTIILLPLICRGSFLCFIVTCTALGERTWDVHGVQSMLALFEEVCKRPYFEYVTAVEHERKVMSTRWILFTKHVAYPRVRNIVSPGIISQGENSKYFEIMKAFISSHYRPAALVSFWLLIALCVGKIIRTCEEKPLTDSLLPCREENYVFTSQFSHYALN